MGSEMCIRDRNARGGAHPDPVAGAEAAIRAGADGITAHLREDRRHITDEDMERLQALCLSENIPLNMEMAAVAEMTKIAKRLKPHAICLVPERREERTTEGGLDVKGQHNSITPIVRELQDKGSRLSLFIEAVPEQITWAARTGAAVVEFHTGAYAHALDAGETQKARSFLNNMKEGAKQASDLGLEVHFGHGLTYNNVAEIAAIPQARELNIGHFLIGEAVFTGLEATIVEMRRLMDKTRESIEVT